MKRTRLKPISDKRKAALRVYAIAKERYLWENPICKVCKTDWAREVHHMKGRTGDLLTNRYYFLGVCRTCHIKIENNPKWAMEKGYKLDRLKV